MEEKGGAPQSPFYRLIDSNGDGLIDYGEYVFFVTVLSGTTLDLFSKLTCRLSHD